MLCVWQCYVSLMVRGSGKVLPMIQWTQPSLTFKKIDKYPQETGSTIIPCVRICVSVSSQPWFIFIFNLIPACLSSACLPFLCISFLLYVLNACYYLINYQPQSLTSWRFMFIWLLVVCRHYHESDYFLFPLYARTFKYVRLLYNQVRTNCPCQR